VSFETAPSYNSQPEGCGYNSIRLFEEILNYLIRRSQSVSTNITLFMKVTISEYNPDWVNLFQIEKKLISDKLGGKIVSVEHIGSTSVPGLGAKPIIDILLGVKNISDADEFIPKMIELGYEYRNNFENVMPYRRYFTKPGFYHVHTVEVTSNFWKRHILFRDYLRVHDDVRDAYYKLKNELAERDWDDINDYALAKTGFIEKAQNNASNEFTNKNG